MARRSHVVKKIITCVLYAALLATAVEAASRTYLVITRHISFWRPRQLLYEFYPELRDVDESSPSDGGGSFDVLLLGGSVLTTMFGNVPAELQSQLSQAMHREVRIYNLSGPAHGILDSYYKYRYLARRRFDLVVLYHGINDVRANNCPADVFRDDFSHYAWYSRVNPIARNRMIEIFSFPTALTLAAGQIRRMAAGSRLLPEKTLPPRWLAFGADVKTARPFKTYLTAITDLARRKKEPVVLMTFAWHIPADYSLSAFRSRHLDYGVHKIPVELWGTPDNVRKGIEAHNRIIRETHRSDPWPVFVDQERLIPKSKEFFDDVAHLTPRGAEIFARNIVGAALAKEDSCRRRDRL